MLNSISRCVTDGYCSLEQADLIQSNLQKKLGQIYQIEGMTEKIFAKSLVNYDDNEDELLEEENSDKKSSTHNNEESNHPISEDKSISKETNNNNKSSISKTATNVDVPSALNLTNQISPSSAKSNLSPGEIKGLSPSSLSEASPISN